MKKLLQFNKSGSIVELIHGTYYLELQKNVLISKIWIIVEIKLSKLFRWIQLVSKGKDPELPENRSVSGNWLARGKAFSSHVSTLESRCGVFDTFLIFFGYFWLFLVIFGYFWLFSSHVSTFESRCGMVSLTLSSSQSSSSSSLASWASLSSLSILGQSRPTGGKA